MGNNKSLKEINLKPLKIAYSILSACLIAFGIMIIAKPDTDHNVMANLCGIILIVFGLVKIKGYFSKDIFQLAFQFDFAMGCVSIVIGVILLFKDQWSQSMVYAVIGTFMLADALLKVQTAIDAKKFGIEKWWTVLLMSLIVAATGVMLLLIPLENQISVIRILGLNICIDGVLNLITVQSTVKTMKRRTSQWEM